MPVKLLAAQHRTRFLGDPQAVLSFEKKRIAPQDAHGYVPLVEWVPAKYLRKIKTPTLRGAKRRKRDI